MKMIFWCLSVGGKFQWLVGFINKDIGGFALIWNVSSNEECVGPGSEDSTEKWSNDWDPEVVRVVAEDSRSVDEETEKSWSEITSWVDWVSEVHSIGSSDHHDDKSKEKWVSGSWDSVSLINDDANEEHKKSSSSKLIEEGGGVGNMKSWIRAEASGCSLWPEDGAVSSGKLDKLIIVKSKSGSRSKSGTYGLDDTVDEEIFEWKFSKSQESN